MRNVLVYVQLDERALEELCVRLLLLGQRIPNRLRGQAVRRHLAQAVDPVDHRRAWLYIVAVTALGLNQTHRLDLGSRSGRARKLGGKAGLGTCPRTGQRRTPYGAQPH